MKIIFALLLSAFILMVPLTAYSDLTPEEKQRIVEYVKKVNAEIEECKKQTTSVEEDCTNRFKDILKKLEELEERVKELEGLQ